MAVKTGAQPTASVRHLLMGFVFDSASPLLAVAFCYFSCITTLGYMNGSGLL